MEFPGNLPPLNLLILRTRAAFESCGHRGCLSSLSNAVNLNGSRLSSQVDGVTSSTDYTLSM